MMSSLAMMLTMMGDPPKVPKLPSVVWPMQMVWGNKLYTWDGKTWSFVDIPVKE